MTVKPLLPKPLIIGNWKMHGSLGDNAQFVQTLARDFPQLADADLSMAICPPFPYLAQLREALPAHVAVGAQNVNAQASGAHTGEVSLIMLEDFGCRYVLLGHSERRHSYGDTDPVVAEKFAAVINSQLTPVLCVGETLEERESDQTKAVVSRQIQSVIDRVGVQGLEDAVIAYEPVWAIGTGKTASPEQAQAVHAHIRRLIAGQDSALAQRLPILYGGSVKPDNAAELFGQTDINGGLVGGASLKAESFGAICVAAIA